MRILSLLVLAVLLISSASAQADPAFGDCALGDATVDLDAADVRARLFNTGGLFWRGGDPVYEVPKGGGVSSLFVANLWLAGKVNDEIRVSYAAYGSWEFWPGPLGENGAAPTRESCLANDRIWHVTVEDVAAYNDSGALTEDLRDWPAALGAPVVDGDGDPGNYDLAGGDRPAILGGETAWWIMNDRGNAHEGSDVPPMGVEVRATAFTFPAAYTVERFGSAAGTFAEPGSRMTFYRFEVTNGNATDVLDTLSVTLFNDMNLGDFSDDYVGSDPGRHLAFAYNSDDDDGGVGYGLRPAAFGSVLLAPDARMTSFVYFNSDSDPVNGFPAQGGGNPGLAVYRYGLGVWKTGQLITVGGDGTGPDREPTTFMYSAPPPAFWSEMDAAPAPGAQPLPPGERRSISTTRRDHLAPGETWTIDYAFVWSRTGTPGPGAALRSLDGLYTEVDRVQTLYDADLLFRPDPRLLTVLPAGVDPVEPTFPATLGLGERPRPHPVTPSSVLDVAVPEDAAGATVEVFDALGRRVAALPLAPGQETVAVGALGLAPGAYVARLAVGGQVGRRAVTFIVAR